MSLAIATHVTLPRTGHPSRVDHTGADRATGIDAVLLDVPLHAAGSAAPAADRARAQAFSEQAAMQHLDRLRRLDQVYEQVGLGLDRIRALAVRASAEPGPIHEQVLTGLLDDLARHAGRTATAGLPALDGGDITIDVPGTEPEHAASIALVDLDFALYGDAGLAQIHVGDADAPVRMRDRADAALGELGVSRERLQTAVGGLERSIALLGQARETARELSDASMSSIRSELAALPPRELALLSSPSARGLMLLEAP